MKIIALGTGTSLGVPLLGCRCDACTSTDTRDKRLRSSVYIIVNGLKILVDVGPDLRQQFLKNDLNQVDCVLFTHEHNDHVAGIDDLRAINFIQKKEIPLYGEQRVLDSLKSRYHYAFTNYPGAPQISLNPITTEAFEIDSVKITPIRIQHGNLPILGFRINDFAYITDASHISESEIAKLQHLDTLIINALRFETHFSHFNLKSALETIQSINPRRAFLTHISHNMGQTSKWEPLLPDQIKPLNDNLVISI